MHISKVYVSIFIVVRKYEKNKLKTGLFGNSAMYYN